MSGILGGWATVGQTDWATNQTNAAGGNVVALGSAGAVSFYTSSAAAGNTASNYTNANIDVVSDQTLDGSTTINTLRFNDTAARTLTLTGTNPIGSTGVVGGILVTPAVGANLSRISGGAIGKNDAAVMYEFIINQFNTQAALQIDSNVPMLSTRPFITKNGAGTVIFTGSSGGTTGDIGRIFLNDGTLQFGDGTGGTHDFGRWTIIQQPGKTLRVAASSTATLSTFSAASSITLDTATNARLNASLSNTWFTKTGPGTLVGTGGSGLDAARFPWVQGGTLLAGVTGTTFSSIYGFTATPPQTRFQPP